MSQAQVHAGAVEAIGMSTLLERVTPTRKGRFTMIAYPSARGILRFAGFWMACAIVACVSMQAQAPYATTSTITSSGSPGNYTLTGTVTGTVPPTGPLQFLDTTNSNSILGTGAIGSPSLTQGVIQTPSAYESNAYMGVATADFNLDGKPDIVMNVDGNVSVGLGTGSGGIFNTSFTLSGAQEDTVAIAVGDFNGDGNPDFISPYSIGNEFVTELGNGQGGFTPVPNGSSDQNAIEQMVVGDFNGDGKLDFLGVDQQWNLDIYLGNGDGTFQNSATPTLIATGIGWIAVGDINGDGCPDIVALKSSEEGTSGAYGTMSLVSFINNCNGTGTFGSPTTISTSTLFPLSVTDVNGDGKPDIVAVSGTPAYIPGESVYGSQVQVLLNNGTGTSFTTSFTSALPSTTQIADVVAADFSQDSKINLDVITCGCNGYGATNNIYSYIGNGDGTFQPPLTSTYTYPNPEFGYIQTESAVADFNLDGLPDIVSTIAGSPVFLDQASATASATVSNISVSGGGTHYVDAYFPGTSTLTASTSSTVALMGTSVPTTLTVTANPSSSTFWQQVTLAATLNPYFSGSSSTNGEPIEFYSNGALIGSGILSSGMATLATTSLAVGTDTITASYATDGTFLASSGSTTETVNKITPTITWPTPTAIPYGTAISGNQLDATASTAGTMAYSVSAGTLLPAGAHTLTVTFTPTNTTVYNTATASVALTVTQVTPTIAWSPPAAITYGTALSATQLDASATAVVNAVPTGVAGSYAYSPAAGTLETAGTHALSVTFTPTDTTDYTTATATVTLTVNKATPTVNWSTPAPITYGTELSATLFDATASWTVSGSPVSVAGSFVYTPAAGALLTAGSHTLSVAFTPTDTSDYNSASATVTQVVSQATPVITWAQPAAIGYGTPLNNTQLDAASSWTVNGVNGPVQGTFAYASPIGTVLEAGSNTLKVTFTPADTTDYSTATATTPLTVNKATATVSWATPASIVYGTALSAVQLDAKATVQGTLTYAQEPGTILTVGTHTLSATFTPNDSTDYSPATTTTTIAVTKAVPVITWSPPAAISYGTALGSAQLNATASTSGSLVYANPSGTILSAGTHQLTVTLTPTDTTDFASATATVSLTVNKAVPTITWANPAGITYGTPLGAAQLNATASTKGTFAYEAASGTVLNAGTQTLSTTFTPADTTDYSTATATATLVVGKAQAVGTVTSSLNPAPIDSPFTLTIRYAGVSGALPPSGSVTVIGLNSSAPITLPLNSAGVATYTTQSLSVGQYPLNVSYSGDANYSSQ